MTQLGMVLPTYTYNKERLEWAQRSFASLDRTLLLPYSAPLLLVKRPGPRNLARYPWYAEQVFQPEWIDNVDQAIAWGFDYLFEKQPVVTHACFLADDFIYSPYWLKQLVNLIERHPKAKGWTVYRSGNTNWHRTISVDENGDHLVTSISGPGAISRQEWKDWHFFCPRPCLHSLDIMHSETRPGERWATGKSYIQQIGVRGVHNTGPGCDEALEFVGEAL